MALLVAVAWHALIVAALTSGTRAGGPVLWKSDAHAAHWQQQSIIEDVDIAPIQPMEVFPKRRLGGTSGSNDSVIRKLSVAAPEVQETLSSLAGPPVVAQAAAEATGEVPISCEVHIHQGTRGLVQAIDFGVCTGDEHWQQRLLATLQQAARLVQPRDDISGEPVKTLVVDTDSLSPEILAAQLMER